MTARSLTIVLGFIAFIALGLPDALLGIAWPFMRLELNRPLEASGIIVMAGTLGAALSGFISSWMSQRFGIGRLLALSCSLTGAALFAYAWVGEFWLIVLCAVVIGLAAGATDATVNGYVAKNFSERLMQWLHACFGIGITLGPLIMTAVLASQLPWQRGYQVHGAMQIALAILFFVTASIWIAGKKGAALSEDEKHEADHHSTTMVQSLKDVRVLLGMMIFFLYCGLEFSVGLWTFSLLTEVRGLSTAQAGIWVSVYWGMFTVGRIVMGFVTHRFSSHALIIFSIALSIFGTLVFALSDSVLANLIALVAIGFAYAPLYPAVVSTTMERVGAEHFNNAMGLQVTGASLGIVILPASIGLIAANTSLSVYPWCLLVITFLMLGAYGLSLHKRHTGVSNS